MIGFVSSATKFPEAVEAITEELRRWTVAKQFAEVTLQEETDPPGDPHCDYSLVYIGRFVPPSTRGATVEIHVSDMGGIGVGFETRDGIAKSLNAKNHREGFGDGFEPQQVDLAELLRFLDFVSAGRVGISARIIPWYGLGKTGAILLTEEPVALTLLKRFYFSASMRTALFAQTLRFEPWR